MVSSNERQSKIRRRFCWPQCGSLDNILGLLFSGSLGISVQQCSSPFCRGGIRYQKRPPTVPNMRAVLKKASWGTRCIIGSIRCKKQASTVRKRYSVQKTGSCGTEWVFKGIWCAEQAPGVRLASRNDPSGEGTQNGTQKAVRNSLQKATQNGTREATQNAIFICEIKDLI